MEVSWTTFKTELGLRKIHGQYIEDDNNYYLKGRDDWFELSCTLYKTPSDTTDLIDFETNFKPIFNKRIGGKAPSPFADKGQLFFRGKGIKQIIPANTTGTIIYTMPYIAGKLNGLEMMGCNTGDTCNFKVLDSTTGSYTTVPNYLLNQFGYDWNMSDYGIKEILPYDADIHLGMQLTVEYTNNSSSDTEVAVNFYIHEDRS